MECQIPQLYTQSGQNAIQIYQKLKKKTKKIEHILKTKENLTPK